MVAAERAAARALGDAGPAARRPLSSDARALRELNAAGREREVVQKFEAGAAGASEGAVGEYVKALVRLDRLDSSALLRTIQRGAAAEMGGSSAPAGAAASKFGHGAAAAMETAQRATRQRQRLRAARRNSAKRVC